MLRKIVKLFFGIKFPKKIQTPK